MSRRATGVGFRASAAFLFGVRYLTAAVLYAGFNPREISSTTLAQFLDDVGARPLTLSVIALAVGVAYLVWAAVDERRGRGADRGIASRQGLLQTLPPSYRAI